MAVSMIGLNAWFNKKILDPLYQILSRGSEPKQLAFSADFGITLGIFPICGVTVLLCGMAIALLGSLCHAPTVMLANFVATPIELSLVVPFLRFGEVISGGPHFPLTSDALKKVLSGQASHEILLSIAHALLGWLVAAPFILAALCIIFLPFFTVLVRKFTSVPLSPRSKSLNSFTEVRLKQTKVYQVETSPESSAVGNGGETSVQSGSESCEESQSTQLFDPRNDTVHNTVKEEQRSEFADEGRKFGSARDEPEEHENFRIFPA